MSPRRCPAIISCCWVSTAAAAFTADASAFANAGRRQLLREWMWHSSSSAPPRRLAREPVDAPGLYFKAASVLSVEIRPATGLSGCTRVRGIGRRPGGGGSGTRRPGPDPGRDCREFWKKGNPPLRVIRPRDSPAERHPPVACGLRAALNFRFRRGAARRGFRGCIRDETHSDSARTRLPKHRVHRHRGADLWRFAQGGSVVRPRGRRGHPEDHRE